MDVLNEQKKPAVDWHPADIGAALRKEGWSMAELSRQAGLSSSTLKTALNRPYPKAELIIAAAIGVAPEVIWPSRYAKRHFKPVFPSIPLSSTNRPAASRMAVVAK